MRKFVLAIIAFMAFALPAHGQTLICGKASSGSGCFTIPASDNSVKIDSGSAATTVLIAGVANKRIFVTNFFLNSAGTASATFKYGTGTTCGTGTTSLTGTMSFVAQGNLSAGNGLGAIMVVPAGNDLCFTNSASVQLSGSISWAQF